MEQSGKMIFPVINEKRLNFYNLGILCGILYQEYVKCAIQRFRFKNSIFHFFPNVARFLKNRIIREEQIFENKNIERTRSSRWLGREIVVVDSNSSGLTPLRSNTLILDFKWRI